MRIDQYPKLIDVSLLVDHYLKKKSPTGIDRVSLAYVRRYRKNALALVFFRGRWSCLDENTSQKIFGILLSEENASSFAIRKMIFRNYFKKEINCRDKLLLHTSHTGLDQKKYLRAVTQKKVKPFYFLHDLIPLTHPEFCDSKAPIFHLQRLLTMKKTGCGLILNSKDTENRLLSYAEKNHWALPKLLVAPLGIESQTISKHQKLIPQDYFVILGTIESRKNHLVIMNVWRRLAEEKVAPIPKLIVIGKRGWECEQVFDMLDRCPAIKEHVIEISNCSDSALITWLFYARALLFPTFTEGYGLPLVEALSLGVPVIASNLKVFHEIAGSIPEYLDPLDGLGWFQIIKDYADENNEKREAQLNRIKNFKQWTWNDHFEMVDNFLDDFITGHCTA